MVGWEREHKLNACRLIALCSDSPALDVDTLSTIIAHAAVLTPHPPQPSSSSSSSAAAKSGTTTDEDAEQSHVNAILSALHVAVGGSFALSGSNSGGSGGVMNGSVGGKAGKAVKGGKKAAAAAAAAGGVTSVKVPNGSISTTETTKMTATTGLQRPRSEWYSVVNNPQWDAPLVFIHQLPGLDRSEEEGGSSTAPTQRPPTSDFCTTLHRALQTIAEELDDATGGATAREGSVVISESHSLPSCEAQRRDFKEIAVVMALREPRTLLALLNNRKALSESRIDTRLIVQFVDSRPLQSPATQGGNANGNNMSSRGRAGGAASKRSTNLEGSGAQLSVGAKDGDTASSSFGICNTFDSWIERYQREGVITNVATSAAASHATGVVCLREVFEGGGEDRSAWVTRCVQTVLPTIHGVVHDMSRYAEWLSNRRVYHYSVANSDLLPQHQQQQQPEDMAGGSELPLSFTGKRRSKVASPVSAQPQLAMSAADRENSRSPTRDAVLSSLPSSRMRREKIGEELEEEKERRGQGGAEWAYYLRESKVRGQWTCASAVRALATQVTVSLARRQQPKLVRPALEDGGQAEGTQHRRSTRVVPVDSEVKEKDIGASLLRQLRQYASKRTILTTLDPITTVDAAAAAAAAAASVAVASDMNATTRSRAGETALASPMPDDLRDQLDATTITTLLPMDHTMDRPTSPPHPEEVQWITQQFVKKALGAFALPPAAIDADAVRDGTGSPVTSFASEHFQAVMRMRELLEEPLNGHTVEEGEDAADSHVLELMEADFRCAGGESPSGWVDVRDAAMASIGLQPVEEKLQRSIERSLTPRERTHILQLVFLEWAATKARMNGALPPSDGPFAEGIEQQQQQQQLASPTSMVPSNESIGPISRTMEESVTKAVAIQRIYEFQSRFGAHLCRLLRCTMPEPLETLEGNYTAVYSTHAENVHPPKRVRAMMIGGVPLPKQRHVQRLWCHHISGVPSLDQFNELVASEDSIASLPSPPPTTVASGGGGGGISRTGGAIGDVIRRQLLTQLQKSRQLLAPTPEEVVRVNNVWRAEGKAQSVVEGRHALYPYDDSVVEVVTTDRGRTCRYVKANELSCALHYSIPSPDASTSESPVERASSAQAARRRMREESSAYFTASFDDGVVLTCTQRWPPSVAPTPVVSAGISSERENVARNSTVSVKSTASRRGKTSSRLGQGSASGKRGGSFSPGFGEESQTIGRRSARKPRGRGRDDGDALCGLTTAAPIRLEQPQRLFPVADDGSVLLWNATGEDVKSSSTNVVTSNVGMVSFAGTAHGLPALAITVAANGVTVHCEEQESLLCISQHGPSNYPAPELLRCVHACKVGATWNRTMEVEVRRVVMEESGIVCRYFHSGATQLLYPDGVVVTRYPSPIHKSSSSSISGNSPKSKRNSLFQSETLVTAAGECYVRQVNRGAVGNFHRLPENTIATRVTYDRGNHCRILSRADGVAIVYYYKKESGGKSDVDVYGGGSNAVDDDGDMEAAETETATRTPATEFGEGGAHTGSHQLLARVTLHTDGTSITTFFRSMGSAACVSVSAPLRLLFEQLDVVEAACGAAVQYCVEAPSLPRVFVCVPTWDDTEQREPSLGGADASEASAALPRTYSASKCSTALARETPVSSISDAATPVLGALAKGEGPPQRRVYDRFYVVFGDGTVLRRRVVYRGAAMPFLETLFTRTTEASVRIIHEAGLAVVEPAEAVRRNAELLSSLAIGEGFAMFDLALGGMRLVDYQHHVTEVRDLFAPGPVFARITPATLESLLRQLVLPTYTPHTVPKALQEAMRQEELKAEAQSRRHRAIGACPPLVVRLRELAESFVIAHDLLRVDVLNSAKRQWKGSRSLRSGGSMSPNAMTAASWGGSTVVAEKGQSAAQRTIATSPSAIAETMPPMGVAPVFFSELENGLVVQYLHQRDVEEYVRAKDAEMFPIFLSHSTAAGEPGVQQLTFFRVKAATGINEGASAASQPRQVSLTSFPSRTLLRGSCGMSHASSSAAMAGSFLGGAVKRQEQLALFSGRRASFPTTRWLPPSMQPPRRFLEPHSARRGDGESGGVTVVDGPLQHGDTAASLSSYERLRVFLKFTEMTPVAQQVVLLGEAQWHKQLTSLVSYHKSMSAMSPEMSSAALEEQRHLREKHLVVSR